MPQLHLTVFTAPRRVSNFKTFLEKQGFEIDTLAVTLKAKNIPDGRCLVSAIVKPKGMDVNEMERIILKILKNFGAITLSTIGRMTDDAPLSKESMIDLINSSSRNVIVLGRDSGKELRELKQVKDYLKKLGYRASLIKDVPDILTKSNEEKVRLWALTSMFCIMIDRTPSGHLTEYSILKSQRTILALLRLKDSGTTYMIADDYGLDYIREFEFIESPLEVIDAAERWARRIADKRENYYRKKYPWRSAKH